MCDKKPSLSDVILAAVCFFQEKNGVTNREIAEYVAEKRGCDVCQVLEMMKPIMLAAKKNKILLECKGLTHISEKYDDLPKAQKKNNNNNNCDGAEGSEEEEEEEEESETGSECGDKDEEKKSGPCPKLSAASPGEDNDRDESPKNSKKRKCR